MVSVPNTEFEHFFRGSWGRSVNLLKPKIEPTNHQSKFSMPKFLETLCRILYLMRHYFISKLVKVTQK